jgi:hypothetical protein
MDRISAAGTATGGHLHGTRSANVTGADITIDGGLIPTW